MAMALHGKNSLKGASSDSPEWLKSDDIQEGCQQSQIGSRRDVDSLLPVDPSHRFNDRI